MSAQFATTHWSTVLAAGDTPSSRARQALEQLCRTYWYPLYAFARREGLRREEAEDAVQAFFEWFLEQNYLKDVARERGRFRSFLLAALKHFLADQRDRADALKRGGQVTFVPLLAVEAEDRYLAEPSRGETVERSFDRAWAQAVMRDALRELGQEHASMGKADAFETLKPFLSRPPREHEYAQVGQRLGLNAHAVAVAVTERAAWVWDLQSGKQLRSFPDDSVRSTNQFTAVFADDTGEHFATIDLEGHLALWREGRAPQHLITIRGTFPLIVRRVFFSLDGRWMANAGEETAARVWDLASGTERLVISERVHQVVFSRDGNRMVTQGAENWITTWDLTQDRKLKVLRGHLTVANAVGLSLDGRLTASAEESGIVKVWSAGLGRELAQERAWLWASTFSPDGRLIANCPWHEGLGIRSVRSGRELLRIRPPNESFLKIAFSPDSRRLVTAGTHKTAKVWDVQTGELLLRLRGHRRQLRHVAYSSDGRRIATGSLDNTAKVWDARTGRELLTLPMDPQKGYALTGISDFVAWVTFDAKGERLLTGSTDGKARIWEVATGRLLATLDPGKNTSGNGGCFLPDQRHVITSSDNLIQVWEVPSGRLLTETTSRGSHSATDDGRDGRRMMAATSEGQWLSPGSGHGTLEVWDIEGSPRRILELSGRELITYLELSPDGRTVACTVMDRCVHRWETFP